MIHPDWIVPDWPAPACIRAFITTRSGGVSTGPYASLNLGFATDDTPESTAENRRRVRAVTGNEPAWLRQVHGTGVIDAGMATDRPEADASYTRAAQVVCAIMVADCLPILLTDRAGTMVAAAHCGWRGLAGGILENTIRCMTDAGISRDDLLAWVGPGIGPRAFEIGEDVYDAFVARDDGAREHFRPHLPGKWHADLPALARRALARSGVTQTYGGTGCTFDEPARFYSYRRDGNTGRMAALIWRERVPGEVLPV